MSSRARDPSIPSEAQISEEAADWLLSLSTDPPAEEAAADANSRAAAFRRWYMLSPRHLRAFLEIYEIASRSDAFDPEHRIQVRDLLADRASDVISLRKSTAKDDPAAAKTSGNSAADRKVRIPQKLAAAVAAIAVTALAVQLAIRAGGPTELVTDVGEQRNARLADGSIVYLNTDTHIAIQFSGQQRTILLKHGEALFVVEHDVTRPFIVVADNARVRAMGTQFNIRERPGSVDVAVVEGVVQVTATDDLGIANRKSASNQSDPVASPTSTSAAPLIDEGRKPTRLAAGQAARVTRQDVTPGVTSDVTETLSWRERRLIFHDATLGEIAAEFNRYNRAKVIVVGSIAQRRRFASAIFDADRPRALILYAAKDPSLEVQVDGINWIIRNR